MTARIIVGAIAFAGASVCCIVTCVAQLEMVARVNERLPLERRFAILWWGPTKTWSLWAEYRRLFPTGTLLRRSHVATALAAACLLVVWSCLFYAG